MSNDTAIVNSAALAAYINTINEECPVPAGDPMAYVDLEVKDWAVTVRFLRHGKLDGEAVLMYIEKAQELGANKIYVERTGEVIAEFRS